MDWISVEDRLPEGVCRPHERSIPVCPCTLFNTPPNPRPLTPPQGWRQGSNNYRSLAPSLSHRSDQSADAPCPRSFVRSCRFALLLRLDGSAVFNMIHKAAASLPRLDGVSVWLHRRLISSPSFAGVIRLKDFFPSTSRPADRLTYPARLPSRACPPGFIYNMIHKAAASLPRLDGVSVWQPRRLIPSPSSAWGKRLKDSFPPISQPADRLSRSACPPWLATARADALTGSPGRARLDLASPVCFASLPFLISFYKKTHKRPVRLPLPLLGSAFLHRALTKSLKRSEGISLSSAKNLRLIFYHSLFTIHYSQVFS